jgi:hypothetical protein
MASVSGFRVKDLGLRVNNFMFKASGILLEG